MVVFVESIGLVGPGLRGWDASRPVLAGSEAYAHEPTAVPPCELLPAAERRRMSTAVKIALAVAAQAFAGSTRDPTLTGSVFATSCGDGDTLDRICETLTTVEREVSPTRFHNSVHNAAAGYWGIASGCMEPSTSICAHDASFSAGLLEAMARVSSEKKAVALIAYDAPYPEPLHSVRPICATFAVALILAPSREGRALAALEASVLPDAEEPTRMGNAGLELVRAGVPAARSLPLLAALARGARDRVAMDLLPGGHLRLDIESCA